MRTFKIVEIAGKEKGGRRNCLTTDLAYHIITRKLV